MRGTDPFSIGSRTKDGQYQVPGSSCKRLEVAAETFSQLGLGCDREILVTCIYSAEGRLIKLYIFHV